MKKLIATVLCTLMIIPSVATAGAEEVTENTPATPSFVSGDEGLYAHGTEGEDTEAWLCWQNPQDEDGYKTSETLYFFLPSGAKSDSVELYNNTKSSVTINDTTIAPKTTATVEYKADKVYKVGDKKVIFKKSSAEAAIFVNNPDADGQGTELYNYLAYGNNDKSKTAKATGAVLDSQGNVDNTKIKKIKGRGNTTWSKPKKPFNVTYESNVSIGGMDKSKKFSLLANYQDATLSRNRILYDMADAVGLPYASDSRYVDFYIDGVYYGSYQCCQKIEVGSKDVVNDIDDKAYLNSDGTIAEDFPFLMEIDPSYNKDSDYHTSASSNQITIKAPELTSDMTGYNEVKSYVASKFKTLYNAISANSTEAQLSEIMDIDSFTKLLIINELGKNWDSGVSSLYLVYKRDKDGNWKFFASPVWDYDNSLGNAKGIEYELSSCGVKDYTDYRGWWCKYKGKQSTKKTSTNLMNRCANCNVIQKNSAQVWFNDFIPVLNVFTSINVSEGEIYSRDVYYRLAKGSADMNYTRGWLLNTGDWIADHSGMALSFYSYESNQYMTVKTITKFPSTFEGEFNFMTSWLRCRAAWLSSQYRADYVEKECEMGDANGDGSVDVRDVTAIQRMIFGKTFTDNQRKAADVNGDGKINICDATALQKKLAAK